VDNVTLVISIDGPPNQQVFNIAKEFLWKHGEKKIILKDKNLGLKKHIIECTDLVNVYDCVIVLEDDLYVSPYFYEYAQQALAFFKENEDLAGISLYSYSISEFSNKPFIPLNDGYDNYFLQLPSSWGQIFTKKQWQGFRNWFVLNEDNFNAEIVPEAVGKWGEHSWKKHFIQYLIEKDLFFVFPKLSLTTNFEDPGTNSDSSGKFQVPIETVSKEYKFLSFNESNLKYDAWYEILPESLNNLVPALKGYDYEVDLEGVKSKLHKPYVLTSRNADRFELSYSGLMIPDVQNVVLDIPGNSLKLTKSEHINTALNPSFSQYSFCIVIPVVSLEYQLLSVTIDSIIRNTYTRIRIVFTVSNTCKDGFLEFIRTNFGSYKNGWFICFCDTKDLGMCLKQGFDVGNGDIFSWIQPGNEINTNDLVLADKVFSDIKQAGAIIPAGNEECGDEYRINQDVIIHILSSGKIEIDTQLIFFKKLFWPSISKNLNGQNLENDNFFSWLLFGLVLETDIYPCLSEIGLKQGKIKSKMPVIDKGLLLGSLYKIYGKSSKSENTTLYKLLRFFSKSKLPLLSSFYYLYYDLPLVIHCKNIRNNAYLFKK